MDIRNGNIYPVDGDEVLLSDVERLIRELSKQHRIPMVVEPTEKQMKRNPPRVGRNEPCPCGSGKKFKRCHLESGRE